MKNKISVYYDGLCHLCSREINHYRKMKGADQIRFVDITALDFDAAAEGVDPVKVHQHMHVRGADGQLHTGVDAFIQIWETLPNLKTVARFARLGPVHALLRVGYAGFARVRPWLPRKECAGPYCEVGKAP